MKTDHLLIRSFQFIALLVMVVILYFAASGQRESFGKRTDRVEMIKQRNRSGASEERIYEKKMRKIMETEYSFGALYGLTEYDIPEKKLDFDELRRDDNPHIYAWLTIPDTVIDYPVVQHPDQPDYYLTHNLDGSLGYPGCIYTQPANSRDWSDNHTVIYGHNMRDGSMFAGLHDYEEKGFLEKNPYIYLYTEDSVRVYRIFAAYSFTDEHLLLDYDTETQQGYEEYLEVIKETAQGRGYYVKEAAPGAGEQIITLSTCIADKPTQRYLVQAVLEAEGKRVQ